MKPTPRSFFKARDWALWALLAILVGAVGLGFGMVIYLIQTNDIALLNRLGLTSTEKIVRSVPFFWIIATIVVIGAAYLNFRRTRKGYRTSVAQFALIAAMIGLALGSVLYVFNISSYLDEAASSNIPLYNVVVPINTGTWFDPEQGLLSGTVKEKDSSSAFTLRGRDEELWTIIGDDIILPRGYDFHPGDRIKIIGEQTGTTTFQATEIHPWKD